MPSEVVQKENEINEEEKEIIEKFEIKEKSTLVTKTASEEKITDETEESNVTEQTESDNKENEEPIIEDVESLKKRAEELLIDGKRHLIIKDFQAAADVLSEACSLLGTVYGEMAIECADAYFKYGCALLELSKDQINPVGLEEKNDDVSLLEENVTETNTSSVTNENAKATTVSITDKSEENLGDEEIPTAEVKPTEDDDKIQDEEMSASEVKPTEDNDKIQDKEMSASEVKPTDDDDKIQDQEMSAAEVKSTEKVNKLAEETSVEEDKLTGDELSVDDEEEKPVEEDKLTGDELSVDDEEEKLSKDLEEDDVNDLQLAWEMLDLAKVIYKNQSTEESKLKLSEVLLKCGEVSIEDEQFETAIADIKESLEIRRLLLPEDSRIIAETLFQLGIAQELGGSGEEAIALLTDAVTVLNQRIKNLEDLTNENNKVKQEEVTEIKAIIPEIKDRIVDIKERKKAAVSALFAAVLGANNEAAKNGGESSNTKQASNINHLVRKRPKECETDGTPTKVPKLEDECITVNK